MAHLAGKDDGAATRADAVSVVLVKRPLVHR
jgi:hypothetical protein